MDVLQNLVGRVFIDPAAFKDMVAPRSGIEFFFVFLTKLSHRPLRLPGSPFVANSGYPR